MALRSRGTPRIANALLRRVRDFAMVKGGGHIDLEITRYALNALNIDARGLDRMDNKILTTIIDKFGGGPVGLGTIATAVSEDTGTIEEVYETVPDQRRFSEAHPPRTRSDRAGLRASRNHSADPAGYPVLTRFKRPFF